MEHIDDTPNAGDTSKFGTNLSILETMYNISDIDVDGINETFSLIGPATHKGFYVAHREFVGGECHSTRVYDSSGGSVDGNFEEILMYEPVTQSVVFTSLLNQDQAGFDSKTHDFEMLVLEDGHATNIATTPYFFYVEIN